jgi:hypothetical protein
MSEDHCWKVTRARKRNIEIEREREREGYELKGKERDLQPTILLSSCRDQTPLRIEKEGGAEEEGNWSRTVEFLFPLMSESVSTVEF